MNYKNLLYEISNATMAPNADAIVVPSNKRLYKIDLTTREVEAPEVLSIQSEHYAETVYFLVDRFYDSMDLAQTNCVVQYSINGENYVYAVPFCDVTTYQEENKMIIPWSISISATRTSGTIKFFLRFYLIDKASDNSSAEFSYSLSTLVGESKVLSTLPQSDFQAEDNAFNPPERYFEVIDTLSQMVENGITYWIDV